MLTSNTLTESVGCFSKQKTKQALLHVLAGTWLLWLCQMRQKKCHFSDGAHLLFPIDVLMQLYETDIAYQS